MSADIPGCHRYVNRIAPTPLVPVQFTAEEPVIWCKLEFLNPSGSTKDRIARFILEKAWRQGRLKRGGRVVEASSGSTSIALALTCAQMGL
jgi:cysteine synthase A